MLLGRMVETLGDFNIENYCRTLTNLSRIDLTPSPKLLPPILARALDLSSALSSHDADTMCTVFGKWNVELSLELKEALQRQATRPWRSDAVMSTGSNDTGVRHGGSTAFGDGRRDDKHDSGLEGDARRGRKRGREDGDDFKEDRLRQDGLARRGEEKEEFWNSDGQGRVWRRREEGSAKARVDHPSRKHPPAVLTSRLKECQDWPTFHELCLHMEDLNHIHLTVALRTLVRVVGRKECLRPEEEAVAQAIMERGAEVVRSFELTHISQMFEYAPSFC
jgi:hypothetical protein